MAVNASPSDRRSRVLQLDLQWAENSGDDNGKERDILAQEQIEALIGAALDHVGHDEDVEISLRMVDEAEMSELNQRFRDKQGPTNVLAFAFEAPSGLSLPFLGDIVVCVPVLRREALQQHKPLNQHFAHLLLHGTLHLLGFDHYTEEQALQMEQAEREILQQFSIPDPYGEIAEQ